MPGQRIGLIVTALLALVLVACQSSRAANIEASVQARVPATVTVVAAPTPRVASPSPSPVEPVRGTLPYSFEQANFRITLLDVVDDPGRHSMAGYRVVQLRMRFDNLLNIRNHSPGCVGFAGLRIKTDQANIYGPNDGGGDL